MSGTPFVFGPAESAALFALRQRATTQPVDMRVLVQKIQSAEGMAAHRAQMTAQTIELPFGYLVTYSLELGHPGGTCRHMSMSSPAPGRVPSPEAVMLVAAELGFEGGLNDSVHWLEDLLRGTVRQQAINLVQPMLGTGGRA